jgi:hypothetical protein
MYPVRRAAIYVDGVRVLPASCCGCLIPEQSFILNFGLCDPCATPVELPWYRRLLARWF